jgi:hypothetical protein
MDRFVKQASREANWVQAPGSARQTPAKRQPGRPQESEEKKRLRREEKEAQTEEQVVEGTPTKRRNEREESLRTAISLLADELLKSDPEKAERAKQIQELLDGDADLKSAEGGKLQGPQVRKEAPSGKLGGANKVKFKEGEGNKGTSAKDKRANANLSYQGGWVRREAHKTIPQKKKPLLNAVRQRRRPQEVEKLRTPLKNSGLR